MEASTPRLACCHQYPTSSSALIIICFIPETLPYAKLHSRQNTQHDDEASDSSTKSYLSIGVVHLKQSFKTLKSVSLIIILLTSLTKMPEVHATMQFFIQYVSKRFSWPLARAGYLLGIRAIVNMAVLIILLPVLGRLLQSKALPFQLSAPAKDLMLLRLSAFFAAVGALFMAGPGIGSVVLGLAINSLAAGFSSLSRSLAASFVDPADTSKLYTLSSIVDTIGSLYAGPAVAWLFAVGMKWKGAWLGLPYFWLASIFALALVALLYVRPPQHKENREMTP